MSKKLKRPIAFIATLAMVCSMLLYLPSGVMTDIGFGLAVSAEGTAHTHTLCGKESCGYNRHNSTTYTPFSLAEFDCNDTDRKGFENGTELDLIGYENVRLVNGNYYLDNDYTIFADYGICFDGNICLNGHTLTIITLWGSAIRTNNITICDCSESNRGMLNTDSEILIDKSDTTVDFYETEEIHLFGGKYYGDVKCDDLYVYDGAYIAYAYADNANVYGGYVSKLSNASSYVRCTLYQYSGEVNWTNSNVDKHYDYNHDGICDVVSCRYCTFWTISKPVNGKAIVKAGDTAEIGGFNSGLDTSVYYEPYHHISPTYQWYSCDKNGENKTAIEGATGDKYSFTAAETAGESYYVCGVSFGGVEEYSDVITVKVPENPKYYNVTDGTAVDKIREALLDRSDYIELTLSREALANITTENCGEIAQNIYNSAIKHITDTNNANRSQLGDYIAKSIGTTGMSAVCYTSGSTVSQVVFSYEPEYYTDKSQEEQVTSRLESIYTELALSELSEQEKVYKIYNWIVNNVSYDYDNLNKDENKTKYTAYGALVDKKAVCQGFSALLYRMCLDNGIDCRIVTGTAGDNNEAHAWNIVKVGEKYYYADPTWDCFVIEDTANGRKAKPGTFFYFLRGTLANHTESTEENVTGDYIMAGAEDYLSAFKAGVVDGTATAVHLDGTALSNWYKITTSGEGCTATVTVKPSVTDTELAAQVLLSETIENHSFDSDGFCTVCKSGYQPAVLNGTTYEISNAGQLYWFAQQVNDGNYGINAILTDNITVNTGVLGYDGSLNSGSFKDWTPISNYTGTFDGNNKTISGLYFNDTGANFVGLFGRISTGGTVKNVGVVDSYISGGENVGGVCGSNNGGTIKDCYNECSVSGFICVGGVCGINNGGKIENCRKTGTVIGTVNPESNEKPSNVGGVCGDNRGTIKDCYNEGSVSGYNSTGGVCGMNDGGTITNCHNKGTVTSSGENVDSAGGVCGSNVGTIQNCHNTGSVSGQSYVGGVCGRNYDGTIKNSYNTGSVSGDNSVGGVCGTNSGTIANCHNTEEVSGNDYRVGGVCGMNNNDGTIKNSYNTGSVSNANGIVGGVCGMNDGIIQNSYNTGSLSKNDDVGGVCGQNIIHGTISNCYCLVGTATNAIDYNVGTSDKVESKTLTQFNSGEVAYLLQSGQTEDENDIIPEVWGQDLSTTTNYPVLGGAKVYQTLGCVGYSNDPTKKHKDENGDEICDVCKEYVDGIGAVAGHSLSLSGNIGVKFFMLLSKDIEYSETAYMQFTLPNGTTEKVLVSNAERDTTKVPDRTCYVFTCEVAAKEMTKTITAQMFDGNGNGGKQHTYTVKDYADYILNAGTYDDKTVALVKAMLNYGAYSQTYFGYNTNPGNLANEGVNLALPDITAADLEAKAPKITNNDSVATFIAAYLSLRSETAANVKVQVTGTPNVTVNGAAVNLSDCDKSGDYYVLTVDNIPANLLDKMYTFTLTSGEKTATLQFGALSYCYMALNNPSASENLKNLCKSIYAYNKAADAYSPAA